MNSRYYQMPYQNQNYQNPNDERFVGAAFPFLLGGVTGAALAPAFYRPRPPYPPYPPYPPPCYQPYRPYYR